MDTPSGKHIDYGFSILTAKSSPYMVWAVLPFYRKSDRYQDFAAQLQDSFAIDPRYCRITLPGLHEQSRSQAKTHPKLKKQKG